MMFLAPAVPPAAVPPCTLQTQGSIVIDPLQPKLHRRGVPRFENGLLTIAAPIAPVRLTEPTDISVTLKGQGARCVQTVQCYRDAQSGLCMARLGETTQIVPVLSRKDGSHYITIRPLLPGGVGLVITAEFANGVFSEQTTYANVEYPSQVPEKLTVSLTGSSGRVSPKVTLDLNRDKQTPRRLIPKVQYPSSPEVFPVAAGKVRFTVKTEVGREAIHFDDSTGTITPVALGHALITTEFGGASTETCVLVVNDPTASMVHMNCDDLR